MYSTISPISVWILPDESGNRAYLTRKKKEKTRGNRVEDDENFQLHHFEIRRNIIFNNWICWKSRKLSNQSWNLCIYFWKQQIQGFLFQSTSRSPEGQPCPIRSHLLRLLRPTHCRCNLFNLLLLSSSILFGFIMILIFFFRSVISSLFSWKPNGIIRDLFYVDML